MFTYFSYKKVHLISQGVIPPPLPENLFFICLWLYSVGCSFKVQLLLLDQFDKITTSDFQNIHPLYKYEFFMWRAKYSG